MRLISWQGFGPHRKVRPPDAWMCMVAFKIHSHKARARQPTNICGICTSVLQVGSVWQRGLGWWAAACVLATRTTSTGNCTALEAARECAPGAQVARVLQRHCTRRRWQTGKPLTDGDAYAMLHQLPPISALWCELRRSRTCARYLRGGCRRNRGTGSRGGASGSHCSCKRQMH